MPHHHYRHQHCRGLRKGGRAHRRGPRQREQAIHGGLGFGGPVPEGHREQQAAPQQAVRHPLHAVPRQRGISRAPVPRREGEEQSNGHARLPPPQRAYCGRQPQVAAQKTSPVPHRAVGQRRVRGRHHKLVAGPVGHAQHHHAHHQGRPQQPSGRRRCQQAHGHGPQYRRVGIAQGRNVGSRGPGGGGLQ